jgi:hypothetical protein
MRLYHPSVVVIILWSAAVIASRLWFGLGLGDWFAVFGVWYLGFFAQFMWCMVTTAVRAIRVSRHPIASLSDQDFRRHCMDHADVQITFYDSVRAGNCVLGTHNFVKRTFRGRQSISLGELLPYCRTARRVKQVAIYKLSKQDVLLHVCNELLIHDTAI